jgi:hypothetical protein
MKSAGFPGKGLSNTQTESSKGTPASGVVKQTDRALGRGPSANPPGKQASGFGFGKGLSNTDTANSSGVQDQVEGAESGANQAQERGQRYDPPSGAAQFPGKGLSKAQTRNSLTSRR